ncbi:DNA-directed RNA polymerase subunit omega [Clostridia bacterium]|nr:DNA-directed RNA polymerase subunit omega [Clostridia bacterium]
MSMINPSIIDLLGHADCRYTLVVNVSKRARQLVGGQPALINTKEKKPLVIAIDEVNAGLITYDKPLEED